MLQWPRVPVTSGASLGPGGSPRPYPSALHVRVRGARARWRAPACLSRLLPPLPLPRAAPGKGAGNRESPGRGPERHGPEGAPRAAGQPRASPPRESRLESAGAGRAHGEARPRPLSYGHQVRGPRGTPWGLAREGQGAREGFRAAPARAGEGMAPKAYWRFQGMPGKGSSGTLPALMATSASCFMPHLVPRARTPPNCLGNVTFTLGGLALQAPAFSQPWGTPWAFDPDPPLGQPLEAGP